MQYMTFISVYVISVPYNLLAPCSFGNPHVLCSFGNPHVQCSLSYALAFRYVVFS
jgi:hypothetical protein